MNVKCRHVDVFCVVAFCLPLRAKYTTLCSSFNVVYNALNELYPLYFLQGQAVVQWLAHSPLVPRVVSSIPVRSM